MEEARAGVGAGPVQRPGDVVGRCPVIVLHGLEHVIVERPMSEPFGPGVVLRTNGTLLVEPARGHHSHVKCPCRISSEVLERARRVALGQLGESKGGPDGMRLIT